jgi:hypothetical protein
MPRRHVTAQERQIIAERARGCCEYCRSRVDFATQSFSVEHIIPASRGGETTLDNLALACPGCNGHKYTKTEAPDPIDGTVVPLYNPRPQRWQDHFRWNADFTRIVGLTPTGRATVSALQMNRPGVMNIRRALFAIGLHPPAEGDE